MVNLAFMYGNGEGIPENIDLGIFWLEKAAENGHEVAKQSSKRNRRQTMSTLNILDSIAKNYYNS